MLQISSSSSEPNRFNYSKLYQHARYIEHKFTVGRAHDIQPELVQDILQIIVESKKLDGGIDSNEAINAVEAFCYAALTDFIHPDSKHNFTQGWRIYPNC
jgi:hypothetical protein